MNYGVYYNYKTIGDILMIVFEPEQYPDKVLRSGDVVSLYKNDHLVGINIFNISNIIKIKVNGYIPILEDKIVDVINDILENAGVKHLPYMKNSGFKVGKILSVEEHPESTHLHILKVDVKSEILDIVCGAFNVKENMKVVVATVGTFMPNGQKIKPGKLLGIDSFGMCCSGRELNLEGFENKRGLLELGDEYEVGEDFWKY